MKAGWSNGENSEVGDQGLYHHGTKETIFVFLGFGDIIFSFAPFMPPISFVGSVSLPLIFLYFPPIFSLSTLSPAVSFSSSVLVY